MIIIISGPPGCGKSTYARALAQHTFPQMPEVVDELPQKKPGFLGSLTIFTWNAEAQDLPKWILGRKDYTVINLEGLRKTIYETTKPSY